MNEVKVPVGVSARHLHLSQEDLERLFGEGAQLNIYKPLSQPGQFAAAEEVEAIGPKGRALKLRVLGPIRKVTQVEISLTDAINLGVQPPVRESGDIEGTPGIRIRGPLGEIEIPEGVIIARRHIHTPKDMAEELGLTDKQIVKVRVEGIRAVTFENVLIRVSDKFVWEFHVDTDEANAALVKTGDMATVIFEPVEISQKT
ncbi:MAG TPA: phosphate propanoyltransferase [Dictyoglomaceae bacterium]|nr:phosphate propanoyltransferase [Dictyoglomaceae bacterium]HOL38989.1 phosphate propanoyltransferase [Dictyoglomaceae bacterium]HPP15835.1 phosphate propanoyltransferase [Dictyoglomaceae bacterium]